MSEKIYACLLRLYPPSFRSKYQDEAIQLYRDRLRDEPGVFRRCRLCCDLLIDSINGLPQAWRNSYAGASPPMAANAENLPLFRLLSQPPLRPASILIGGALSFAALSAFGLVMGLPTPSRSTSGAARPRSAIEAVMDRLNGPAPTGNENQIASVGAASPLGGQSPARQPAFTSANSEMRPDNAERKYAATFALQNASATQPARSSSSAPNGSPLPPPAGSNSLSNASAPLLEVVSVRETKGNPVVSTMGVTDDGLVVTNMPLLFLVQTVFAGHFTNGTLTGLPSWEMTRYDIEGKVSDANLGLLHNLNEPQRVEMLRSMLGVVLVERFHMVFHLVDRDGPVYRLVLTKDGSKLKEAPSDEVAARINQRGSIQGAISMGALGHALSGPVTGRPVIDDTGLQGNYDVRLMWTPDLANREDGGDARPAPAAGAGPSIFTAVQEQLGLKLAAARGPVNGVVIDHIEKPTPN